MFANHLPDEGLVPRLYKELNKKKNTLFLKKQRTFLWRRCADGWQAHGKCSVSSGKQNHKVIPCRAQWEWLLQRKGKTANVEDVEKPEPFAAGGCEVQSLANGGAVPQKVAAMTQPPRSQVHIHALKTRPNQSLFTSVPSSVIHNSQKAGKPPCSAGEWLN